MDTQRFDYRRQPDGALGPRTRKYPKWVRVFHVNGPLLRNSSGSGRRKIFAIVAPSASPDGRKRVQHVLIFDSHPDSLRLASEQDLIPTVDLAAPLPSRSHVLLGLGVIITLVVGMIWPLL